MQTITKINSDNKIRMKNTITENFNFPWEDSELENILTFNIKNNNYIYEKAIKPINTSINEIIGNYNNGKINHIEFLEKIKLETEKISINQYKNYYFFNLDYYNKIVKKQKKLILHGPGGIGKSRFFYDLYNKLIQKKIKCVALYGKYNKTFIPELFEEIETIANKERFVLMYDAINEIEDECERTKILNKIQELSKHPNIYIFLSYRDGSTNFKLEIEDFYSQIFPGIDFVDAVNQLISLSGKYPFEYDDILYTNNPLLIEMLYSNLNKNLSKNNNAVTSITTLYENYIKNEKCCSQDGWLLTKKIADLMFETNKKYIFQKEFDDKINFRNKNHVLDSLIQFDFICKSTYNRETIYTFSTDSFADYLIGRSLFDFMEKNNLKNLSEKLNYFPTLHKIVPLIFFDLYEDPKIAIEKIKEHANLRITSSILSKIKPNINSIESIQNEIDNIPTINKFVDLGGLINKPFNCQNYLHKFFLSYPENYFQFTLEVDDDSEYTIKIKRKLYNILCNINNFHEYNVEFYEYFLYSIWSCGLFDNEIRIISAKILIKLVDLDPSLSDELIEIYDKVNDFIKEHIVLVLTKIKYPSQKTKIFLLNIMENKNYIHAENLTRMAIALYADRNKVISLKKKSNIKNCNNSITSKIEQLFSRITLYNKYLLKFEYNYDDFYSNIKFLNYSKKKIKRINKKLNKKYSCIDGGECSGLMILEKIVSKKNRINCNNSLDTNVIAKLTAFHLNNLLKIYNITINNSTNNVITYFILLAQNYALGELMSKYYLCELASFNNEENTLGFEIYNPLEYEYEKFNLNSTIPIFSDIKDHLDQKIIKKLQETPIKDDNWYNDINTSKKTIKYLMEDLTYKNTNWVPIVLYIQNDNIGETLEWKEHYNFYISSDSERKLISGDHDRCITIDVEKYFENLHFYTKLTKNKKVCHSMPSFIPNSDMIKENFTIIPPASIITTLELSFDESSCSWKHKNDDVIICNKNKSIFEKNYITYSAYMKKNYFDILCKKIKIKFYGFTEKYTPDNKNFDNAFDFVINDGKFEQIIMHYDNEIRTEKTNLKCANCKKRKKFIDDPIEKNLYNFENFFKIFKE